MSSEAVRQLEGFFLHRKLVLEQGGDSVGAKERTWNGPVPLEQVHNLYSLLIRVWKSMSSASPSLGDTLLSGDQAKVEEAQSSGDSLT